MRDKTMNTIVRGQHAPSEVKRFPQIKSRPYPVGEPLWRVITAFIVAKKQGHATKPPPPAAATTTTTARKITNKSNTAVQSNDITVEFRGVNGRQMLNPDGSDFRDGIGHDTEKNK